MPALMRFAAQHCSRLSVAPARSKRPARNRIQLFVRLNELADQLSELLNVNRDFGKL
jgi:hypothetical protein